MEKKKRVPNLLFTDDRGETHQLDDFNQRAHVVLIHCPGTPPERVVTYRDGLASRQPTWDWLGVKIFLLPQATPTLDPGVFIIDRYGTLIEKWPMEETDLWARIEKELVYHEARHC